MITKVSEKGQVTIPKQLRERLGIGAGDELDFEEEDGRLVAAKHSRRDPVEAAYGVLSGFTSTDRVIDQLRGPADLT